MTNRDQPTNTLIYYSLLTYYVFLLLKNFEFCWFVGLLVGVFGFFKGLCDISFFCLPGGHRGIGFGKIKKPHRGELNEASTTRINDLPCHRQERCAVRRLWFRRRHERLRLFFLFRWFDQNRIDPSIG